jgi:hypothetical protein
MRAERKPCSFCIQKVLERSDTMADISAEIQAFRDAVYGEEVRGSMISLAEKVNADGENALSEVAEQVTRIDGIAAEATQTLEDAQSAISEANTAIERADDAIAEAEATLNEGAQQVQQAAGSADLAESWAIGDKGIRPGENSNNSKYFSMQSKTEADRAKEEADRAQQYAGITIPNVFVNFESRDLEYTSAEDIVLEINYQTRDLEWEPVA